MPPAAEFTENPEERNELISGGSSEDTVVAPSTSITKKLVLVIVLTSLLAIVFAITLGVVVSSQTRSHVEKAVCIFNPSDKANVNKIEGNVTFTTTNEGVAIQLALANVPGTPGTEHSFAIFDYSVNPASPIDPVPAAVGSVYNPGGAPHGCLSSNKRRVGDMKNVKVAAGKAINEEFNNRLVMLSGPWSVVGRSVIIFNDKGLCEKPEPLPADKRAGVIASCNIVIASNV